MTNMLQKIFGQIETKEQFDALRITIASPEEILSWSRDCSVSRFLARLKITNAHAENIKESNSVALFVNVAGSRLDHQLFAANVWDILNWLCLWRTHGSCARARLQHC